MITTQLGLFTVIISDRMLYMCSGGGDFVLHRAFSRGILYGGDFVRLPILQLTTPRFYMRLLLRTFVVL